MALHEDLRKTHLPPDTLRALLAKQIGRISDLNGGVRIRWYHVSQILNIMESTGIRGNREDMETIILEAIDISGMRKTKSITHDTLHSIWRALSKAQNGRLQNISAQTRERWLMYRLRKFRRPVKEKPSESHLLGALKGEWRQLASQGFFQRFTLPIHVTTVLHGDYRLHMQDIMETLRIIHDSGGIITVEALRAVWRNFLESRVADFNTPDIQTYQYMNQVIRTESTGPSNPFDTLVQNALHEATADITGGVSAIALVLYLPSERTDSTRHVEGASQAAYEIALDFARRRMKHIPTQPTEEQAPHIVTTLGFGAVIIKNAINQGTIISDNVVVTLFRVFRYLPKWLRTDDRYARRIESALLLLVRSLRSQDNTWKQWQSVWPTMLKALAEYSSTREIREQAKSLYRQMRIAKSPAYTEVLSVFCRDRLRRTVDIPWIALEFYVDAERTGVENLNDIRDAIVHQLSRMEDPAHLQRLRTKAANYRHSDEARPIVLGLLQDAIGQCQSAELTVGLYEISSGISTPRDLASVRILNLLLCKMKNLGDQAYQQFAVDRVEAEWGRGVKLSRSGMETLASLVGTDSRGAGMDDKVKALESALGAGERLVIRS